VRVAPERSHRAQLGAVLVLMVGGPWGWLRLVMLLAPDSDVIQALAPLAFAGVLVGGLPVRLPFPEPE